MQKINEIKNNILSYKNYVVIYGETGLDLSALIFPDFSTSEILSYQADDKYYSKCTKMLSFFNIHNATYEHENNLNVNDFELTKAAVVKDSIKGIEKIFHLIKNRKFNKLRKYFNVYSFTDEELNILTKIIFYYKKEKKKVIMVDNFDNAPSGDLAFFKKFLESKFLELHTPDLQFVFIADRSMIDKVDLDGINSKKLIKINLTDSELKKILTERYAGKKVDDSRLNYYLALCNNNLHLLDKIIDCGSNIDNNADMVHTLTVMVRNILSQIKQVNALEFAAIVGLVFDISSVSGAMTLDTDEIIYQFEEAQKNGLIFKRDDNYNFEFIDELIRHIVYDSSQNKHSAHLLYANYLNRTTPRENLFIAKQYFEGCQKENAILHFFCYIFNSCVENKEINNNLDIVQSLTNLIKENANIHASFLELQDLLSSFKMNNLENLTFNDGADTYSLFVNYVKTVLKYLSRKIYSEKDFQVLADRLEESYLFLKDKLLHYEKMQCLLYLIDIYSYRINVMPKTKEKVLELKTILHDKSVNFNSDINLQLKIMRKIAKTMNAETAFAKTNYFYLSLQQSNKNFDEIERFKYISDYMGFALYSGNYKKLSKEFICDLQNSIETGKCLNYPKIYKAYMNLMLFKIFNHETTKLEMIDFLNEERNKNITGRMYLFDLSAIALLCGNYKKAEMILTEIVELSKDNMTCFYDYCFHANLASLYLLKKDYISAEKYNNKILRNDYDWEQDFIDIMRHRAELFDIFIKNKQEFTPETLFHCFDENDIYLSSIWNFLGKGIIFSELMYYRE